MNIDPIIKVELHVYGVASTEILTTIAHQRVGRISAA